MAKRMILVDPAHVMMKTNPVPDQLTESVLTIDDEMRNILNSRGMTDHDKLKAYQNALQKYLSKVGQLAARGPIHSNSGVKPSANAPASVDTTLLKMENRVVESVPETLRKKARLLLDHLKETSDLVWNDRGEIELRGETVSGSNIADLVNETVRARKMSDEPKGWSVFARALKESNVPQELIGNKTRWLNADNSSAPRDRKTPVKKPEKTELGSVQEKSSKGATWKHYYG